MEFKVYKPCSSSDVYDIIPDPLPSIDLDQLREKLESSGFEITLSNKYFLKGVKDELELTVYARGKFLVKNAGSKENALQIVKSLIN